MSLLNFLNFTQKVLRRMVIWVGRWPYLWYRPMGGITLRRRWVLVVTNDWRPPRTAPSEGRRRTSAVSTKGCIVPPFIVKTNLNNLLVTYLLYRMTLVVSHLSERLSFQHLKVLCIQNFLWVDVVGIFQKIERRGHRDDVATALKEILLGK